jgi:hypothetical protein
MDMRNWRRSHRHSGGQFLKRLRFKKKKKKKKKEEEEDIIIIEFLTSQL